MAAPNMGCVFLLRSRQAPHQERSVLSPIAKGFEQTRPCGGLRYRPRARPALQLALRFQMGLRLRLADTASDEPHRRGSEAGVTVCERRPPMSSRADTSNPHNLCGDHERPPCRSFVPVVRGPGSWGLGPGAVRQVSSVTQLTRRCQTRPRSCWDWTGGPLSSGGRPCRSTEPVLVATSYLPVEVAGGATEDARPARTATSGRRRRWATRSRPCPWRT